jgi:hypothetical protein
VNLTLALAALFGFLLSLVVHILALSGMDVSAHWPTVWMLHLGIFVVFIPLVISNSKRLGAKPKFADFRADLPGWVLWLGVVFVAYSALNFILFILGTQGGSPDLRDGKYLLLNHGKLIRELTKAEYTALKANEVRGFSGHWLVFYYISFAYFMFVKKRSAAHTN